MTTKNELYKLTDGDKAIFARARTENNPNWITNYYLRNDDSGTWWRVVTDEQIAELEMPESKAAATSKKETYEALYDVWEDLGKPDYFGPDQNDPSKYVYLPEGLYKKRAEELQRVYRLRYDADSPDPIFHHPHGILLLPWHMEMYRARQPIQVIFGGFGSSKTYGKSLIMMTRAVTLPGYRAFALAPVSVQSEEVHKIITQMIEGTLFERFLISSPLRPVPTLKFGNDYTGVTTIECYPIKDNTKKIRTLTGDEALVDQAEDLDAIDELIKDVGTRFRGQFRGRPRIGQITFLANSEDNAQLWDRFDEADTNPRGVWSYAPSTFQNTYLTVKNLKDFEDSVGKDEVSRRRYMKGERPIGSGEHFSAETLTKCRDLGSDERMNFHLAAGTPGWVRAESPRTAVYRWERPYEDGCKYIVVADTGYGDPPERNAAVVAVFKVDDFPKRPAQLVAFHWVFGGHSPKPWMAVYTKYVMDYKAIGMNGYDATGPGAGYSHMTDINTLLPDPVMMGGQNKFLYLNLTKKLMAEGLIIVPASIVHLFSQCAKYRIPDDNTRQDIVMMLLVASALLNPMYYVPVEGEKPDDPNDFEDRDWRPESDRDEIHTER